MIKIVAHETNMKIPIFNTLYNEDNKFLTTKKLDINKLNNLNFTKVDLKKFPLIKILSKLSNQDSLFETIIVSANDELVQLFLSNKIKFTDISNILIKFLNFPEFSKYKYIQAKKIETIVKLNKYVRFKINNISV